MTDHAAVDILLRANEDWRDLFWLASSADAGATLIDLSAATLTLHVRRAATDAEVALVVSEANGRLTRQAGALYRAAITNAGSGYPAATTITFANGGSHASKRLPSASVVIGTGGDAGKIVDIIITDAGAHCDGTLTASIAGSGGSGAAVALTLGTVLVIGLDWTEIAHLSGAYVQDLVAEIGGLRAVIWAGAMTVEEGVTR